MSLSTGHTFVESSKPAHGCRSISESSSRSSGGGSFTKGRRFSMPMPIPCNYAKMQNQKKTLPRGSESKDFEVRDNVLYQCVAIKTEVENEYEVIKDDAFA